MIVIVKEEDGSIDAVEISDADDLGPLTAIEAGLAGLLADEDAAILAADMTPGSVAGVLVYENLWAAPFAAAARRAGGVLISDGRIAAEDVVAAIAGGGRSRAGGRGGVQRIRGRAGGGPLRRREVTHTV